MDTILHCNDLNCRANVPDQAVVTTCSHIFCIPCANRLGLAEPKDGRRSCPACKTELINPDDAVIASLSPTEDYKTSILSGLSPTIIMECAGRGLGFWAYQMAQEITYQQYLGTSLAERYQQLGLQLEAVTNKEKDENNRLRQRLDGESQELQYPRRWKTLTFLQLYKQKMQISSRPMQHLIDHTRRKPKLSCKSTICTRNSKLNRWLLALSSRLMPMRIMCWLMQASNSDLGSLNDLAAIGIPMAAAIATAATSAAIVTTLGALTIHRKAINPTLLHVLVTELLVSSQTYLKGRTSSDMLHRESPSQHATAARQSPTPATADFWSLQLHATWWNYHG